MSNEELTRQVGEKADNAPSIKPVGETTDNVESTNELKGPNGEPFITDPKLTEMYKEGFLFAINYLHAIAPKGSKEAVNKDSFKEFIDDKFTDVEILDDFFKERTVAAADGIYPEGVCPGPGGKCVACPSMSIQPISNVDEA